MNVREIELPRGKVAIVSEADWPRVSKIRWSDGGGGYVPGDFLCHGDNGYGDYIIMSIGPDGRIADYKKPDLSRLGDGWRVA